MSEADKRKLKDLPVRKKIADKHENTLNALLIITYIIFFPCVISQVIVEKLDELISILASFREKIVYSLFKLIYKKEIIENEIKTKELSWEE